MAAVMTAADILAEQDSKQDDEDEDDGRAREEALWAGLAQQTGRDDPADAAAAAAG